MRDIQISRPVLIAIVGAVLLGGFVLFRGSQSDEVVAPTPVQTAGPTGASGGTGPTGPTRTAPSAAEIRAKRRAALVKKAKAAGMPTNVYDAMSHGKEVVILFWEPDGRDDRRVNAAVNTVKAKRKKVVVFRSRIANKSKYDGIAQAANVTQTPAVVALYRGKADSAQGYFDANTLNVLIARLVAGA